ncbi:LysR family transcriptional regulator ArgP [Aidingimonas halophila]|uniref:LysR family transcriptional regulator, chromosome initiation inhibitor n=1 Tax=Aidingimonas halophila TaxID=574349 RepID=A0A1H3DC37_9GAMM|nr:LysR family transcriptional regulator ArgP [Aidingimonas halophila]GHC30177.1 transcriptional regulator ArgP [Aidingimonas halophila]SDX63975.1 LysR family transcriptional regulator, chromosome initiation inhibitor [Aidingimonas halophila]
MLDYKLLEALATVVDQSGFERAARHLGLTQSAISQRIKLLEARLGQPVLVRSPSLAPTAIGRQLLNHVLQVSLLEHDLLKRVPALGEREQRLRLAINADSLTTWWSDAVGEFCQRHDVLLDMVVEDQDVALKRMRDGEVAGCVCATQRPVQGARSYPLGGMRYRALASPAYITKHFPNGITQQALRQAPAIVYGPDDRLQHRYLELHGVRDPFPHHLCPSSHGFVRLALADMGYGLFPEHQVHRELAEGKLVDLDNSRYIDVPLYWHHWRHGGETLDALTRHLLSTCHRWLAPLDEGAH